MIKLLNARVFLEVGDFCICLINSLYLAFNWNFFLAFTPVFATHLFFFGAAFIVNPRNSDCFFLRLTTFDFSGEISSFSLSLRYSRTAWHHLKAVLPSLQSILRQVDHWNLPSSPSQNRT